MGRRTESPSQLVHALHTVLLEDLGVPAGARISRGDWDGLVMVAFDVAHRNSVTNYTTFGRAVGLWAVHEAHGKGGRGYVELKAPRPRAAT